MSRRFLPSLAMTLMCIWGCDEADQTRVDEPDATVVSAEGGHHTDAGHEWDAASQTPVTSDAASAEDAALLVDAGPDSGSLIPAEGNWSAEVILGPDLKLSKGCVSATMPRGVAFEGGFALGPTPIIAQSDTRVFVASDGRWQLRDRKTTDVVAAGAWTLEPTRVGILQAGDTLILPSGFSQYEVRDMGSGALLSQQTAAGLVGIAGDGSYWWDAEGSHLRVWKRDGSPLFSRDIDLTGASVSFGSPDALLIAAANTLRRITLAGQDLPSVSYVGELTGWFRGGQHFVTLDASTLRVYELDGTIVDSVQVAPPVAHAGGAGDRWWFDDGVGTQLRALGSTAPLASVAGGTYLGSSDDELSLSASSAGLVVELSSGSVISSPLREVSTAAEGGGRGMTVRSAGMLMTWPDPRAQPEAMFCGVVRDITASHTGRIAIQSSDGQLHVMDLREDRAHLVQRFYLPEGGRLSPDGQLVVAVTTLDDGRRAHSFFDAESGARVHDWPLVDALASVSPTQVFGYAFGGAPAQLARQVCSWSSVDLFCVREILDVGTKTTTYSEQYRRTLRLGFIQPLSISPVTARVASSTLPKAPGTRTVVIENGAKLYEFEGLAIGWLDANRLYVNTYEGSGMPIHWSIATATPWIVDIAAKTRTPAPVALPELSSIRPLSNNRVYAPDLMKAYSLADGSETPIDPAADRIGTYAGAYEYQTDSTRVTFRRTP
jgi:hypothetical protein